MKNKFYTVFFASERNNYSRSIQVSRWSLIIVVLFGTIILSLAGVGGLRITNQDKLIRELGVLKENKFLVNNILSDLNYSSILDSSNKYEIFLAEHFDSQKAIYPDLVPVEGYVTRGLQKDQNHPGIDIAAKYQDEIKSPADGRVFFSGISTNLGNTLILNHPGGFITVYGHLDSNLVNSGEAVIKGQIIARVGETGKNQGPHLHFEIWKNNQVLDPREIIPEYKQKDVSIR